MSDRPAADDCERAVTEARRMFQRTLAAWVGDLLVLRRSGGDRPAWNPRRARGWRDAA